MNILTLSRQAIFFASFKRQDMTYSSLRFPVLLSALVLNISLTPFFAFAGTVPIELTSDAASQKITPQITIAPEPSKEPEPPKEKAIGIPAEAHHKILEAPITITTEEPKNVQPTIIDDSDFVTLTSRHCKAFINERKGNFEFLLNSRTKAQLSQAEKEEFSQKFSEKIVNEYRIDASQACVLNTASVKDIEESPPHRFKNRNLSIPVWHREIAIVGGQLPSTLPNMFVSIAYKLERIGKNPWIIDNITLNGQPLDNRAEQK